MDPSDATVDEPQTPGGAQAASGSSGNDPNSQYTRPHQLFIEHLTHTKAGEPLAGVQQKHTYELYHDCLQAKTTTEANIWAPFISKMDWEVARWAKLCGPGSTAVSELLSIENVSMRSQHYCNTFSLTYHKDTR